MPPTTAGTSTRTGSVPTEAAKCDLGESSWISTALSMAGGHRRPDTAGEEWMSGDDADGAMKGGCSRGFPEGQAVDIERKSRRREEGLGRRGRRAGQWGTGGSLRLLVVVLAVLLSTASSQLTPIIASVSVVTIKACPNTLCAPVNVQITVGHQDATFPLAGLQLTWSTTPILDLFSPLSSISSVIEDGAQRVIAVKSNGKIFGDSTIVLTLSDVRSNPRCTIRCSATTSFKVRVEALSPVFDAFGPTRTLVDLKTMIGTPTYPYTFLIGHEDEDKIGNLVITPSSLNPDILPNICCNKDVKDCNGNPCCAARCSGANSYAGDSTNTAVGGFQITLYPYSAAEGLSFVVGEFVVQARRVQITIRPSVSTPGPATLSFRLSDGPPGSVSAISTLQTVTVNVFGRPTMDKFCAYDVLADDSLRTIADIYGMHWMTVFMFNNHTLPHPDSLVPGSRISIGRPYIVKPGDSLYSIATKYGTTWQQIKALNPAIILDEKSLFVGQLLCIAPDLAFVNCRNRF